MTWNVGAGDYLDETPYTCRHLKGGGGGGKSAPNFNTGLILYVFRFLSNPIEYEKNRLR